MRIKDNVGLYGITPAIVIALMIADDLYDSHGDDLMITSALDGHHMHASLHYVGAAVDIRLPSANAAERRMDLLMRLGSEYDVVLEANHIHIEHQPKVGHS